jgi:hypothetical protein
MQACTTFRLATLANDYWPLLNNCKAAVDNGWQTRRPTEAEILRWDRSIYRSTGMKIDDDLAVIDVDVLDQALVEALKDAFAREFPALFAHGIVRHAGQPKEAWFARVDKPFRQFRSRRWYHGGDLKDRTTPQFRVECFGSRATRQFGIDGPHTREAGRTVRVYQCTNGASPATVPRSELPVLPQTAYARVCDLFEGIAAAADLVIIPRERDPDRAPGAVVYDLTDDMVFENGCAAYRGLEELAEACVVAEHQGHKLRVTSSFLGHGTNTTKCIVGYAKGGRYVFIHDFETGLTHKPANRAPPDTVKFFELLNRGAK